MWIAILALFAVGVYMLNRIRRLSGGPRIPAPSGLTYATNPASYGDDAAISANSPTVTGTVTSYSVSPALPAGLSLHATTGVISGTPTTPTASAVYVVTATNAGGSTTCDVTIEITDVFGWDNLTSATTSGSGELTFTGSSGTVWSDTVDVNTDCEVSFTLSGLDDIEIGLTSKSTVAVGASTFSDMDYSIYIGATDQAYQIENEVIIGGVMAGFLPAGSVVTIRRTSNVVTYHKNGGAAFRTSATSASGKTLRAGVKNNAATGAGLDSATWTP